MNAEDWKKRNDACYERFKTQWEATYDKHHSPSGWACLGAEVRDGICHCPVCEVVRAKRETDIEGTK